MAATDPAPPDRRGVGAGPPLRARGLLRSAAARRPGRAAAARPGLGPRGWAPGDLPLHLVPAAVTAAAVRPTCSAGSPCSPAGRRASHAGRLGPVVRGRWRRGWPLRCCLALLTAPFGSADHTNYAAYGRIRVQGGDPYVRRRSTWHGGHGPGDPRGRAAVDDDAEHLRPVRHPAAGAGLPASAAPPCARTCGSGRSSSSSPGSRCGGCCCVAWSRTTPGWTCCGPSTRSSSGSASSAHTSTSSRQCSCWPRSCWPRSTARAHGRCARGWPP